MLELMGEEEHAAVSEAAKKVHNSVIAGLSNPAETWESQQ